MSRDGEKGGSGLPAHLQALLGAQHERLKDELDRLLERSADGVSTGRFSRAFKLSRLAMSGGSKLALGTAKKILTRDGSSVWAGERGVDFAMDMLGTFGELRGVAMKVGQMLSYVDDGLPPEARKILALLQRDAPAMPFEQVRTRLESELQRSISEVFAELDPRPMAAASIGQVHRARLLDGTDVAVKIQYPGIDQAMTADLKNAKVASLFKQALFVNTDIKGVMDELEQRLLDECDYRKEAEYQEAFRARFAGHPRIVIPAVRRELVTKHVLVTTLEHGSTYYQWLDRDPALEERERVGRTFYRFYLGSFYLDGLFNCDPHPGNYLFRDDGKVVFLDFGCSRRFTEERRLAWIGMVRAVQGDDAENLHRQALEVGFIKPDVSYDRAALRELLRYLYEPHLEDAEYDFARHQPGKTFRAMFTQNPNLFRLNMPADAVFLNRITFGLVSLLTEIGAPLNCHRIAESYFSGIDPDWTADPFLLGPRAERAG